MEKAKTRKIKKWDEVHGEHEVEVSDNAGGCEPEEVAGASPSISRNPMRSIEDMVEQNDKGSIFKTAGWKDPKGKRSE